MFTPRRRFSTWLHTLGVLSIVLSFPLSCGYGIRRSPSPFLKEENIKKVYVSSLRNDSFKPGIEITVYNALVKEIARVGILQIVQNPVDADAIITGNVNDASYKTNSTTASSSLQPLNLGNKSTQVATSYTATLNATFALSTSRLKTKLKPSKDHLSPNSDQAVPEKAIIMTVHPTPTPSASAPSRPASLLSAVIFPTGPTPLAESSLWSGGSARSKTFSANNQLAALGTTSSLINESEFERALQDLAELVVSDTIESMFSSF